MVCWLEKDELLNEPTVDCGAVIVRLLMIGGVGKEAL